MKKIVIACVGLLLMFTYGCSSEDTKEAAEKTKQTAIEAQEKTAEVLKEAATATQEAAIDAKEKAVEMANDAASATQDAADELKDKAAEMTDDTVKKPNKRPALEGC